MTDVTNASRTMLMNIDSLCWDPKLLRYLRIIFLDYKLKERMNKTSTVCSFFDLPCSTLPEIRSSSEIYGHFKISSLKGIPISGVRTITSSGYLISLRVTINYSKFV